MNGFGTISSKSVSSVHVVFIRLLKIYHLNYLKIWENRQVPLKNLGIDRILLPMLLTCEGRRLPPGIPSLSCWGPSTPSPAESGTSAWSLSARHAVSSPQRASGQCNICKTKQLCFFLEAILLWFNLQCNTLSKIKINVHGKSVTGSLYEFCALLSNLSKNALQNGWEPHSSLH